MALDNKKDKENISGEESKKHPSSSLEQRSRGFGIGGGYERPYSKDKNKSPTPARYGPIPHSGYYGSVDNGLRFKIGQAGFRSELPLYKGQYGVETSKKKQ